MTSRKVCLSCLLWLDLTLMTCFTADIISCVEFSQDGNLLATGDKGGRVVIFQRDEAVSISCWLDLFSCPFLVSQVHPSKGRVLCLHDLSITWTRVWLSQVSRNRGKDQQDSMAETKECCPVPLEHQRQDCQALESVWEGQDLGWRGL